MMALVVPTGDYETQAKMLDEIAELDHVTSVLGIASVEVMDGYRLGDKLTIGEFSELAGHLTTRARARFSSTTPRATPITIRCRATCANIKFR